MSGFPKKLIPLFTDKENIPFSVLEVREGNDEHVMEGTVGSETERYTIERGILRLLNKTHLAENELNEVHARDNEADGYCKRLAARYFREVKPLLRLVACTQDDVVLDLGCGTGRMVKELVVTGAQIVAVDFSFESLIVAQACISDKGCVGFVEADVATITLQKKAFSKIISTQVLEHVVTPEKRAEFVSIIYHALALKGKAIITAYHHNMQRRAQKLPIEGMHRTGIYFHYFTQQELRSLFTLPFVNVHFRYFDLLLPGTTRLALPERVLGVLSELLTYSPLRCWAHLIGVVVEKA